MGQLQGSTAGFVNLYDAPSIERMLSELDDHQFEHFVAYVFELAGYAVEDTAYERGPSLDLKLYIGSVAPGNLRAGVEAKRWKPDRLITAPEVGGLRNGIAQNGGVSGYFEGVA